MLQVLYTKLDALLADRKGISALEYGVLAAGIIGVVAAAALTLGGDVSTLFGQIGSSLTYHS